MVAGWCSDDQERAMMLLGDATTRRDLAIVVRRSDMEEDGGMSSARRWMEIVDGGDGAVMRCRKVVKIVIRELESRSRAS